MLKERDEQAQLALQERDLQKMAALAQHDERLDLLLAQVESLKTARAACSSLVTESDPRAFQDNLQLVSNIGRLEEGHGLAAEQSQKLARLEQQLAVSQDALADQRHRLDAKERRVLALETELAASERLRGELASRERSLEDKCAGLQGDLERCNEQVASLGSSAEASAAELGALRHHWQVAGLFWLAPATPNHGTARRAASKSWRQRVQASGR